MSRFQDPYATPDGDVARLEGRYLLLRRGSPSIFVSKVQLDNHKIHMQNGGDVPRVSEGKDLPGFPLE